MCGRYTLRKSPEEVPVSEEIHYVVAPTADNFEPRFNIAPTQSNLVLRRNERPRSLTASRLRWGLVPSWAKSAQASAPMINARCETVADKPSFRGAFQRRRCLVPADGFYEWKKSKAASQPFHFALKDDSIFYMAGVWDVWHGDLGERVESFTILTTQANSLLAKFHDRMPVILMGEKIPAWLENASASNAPLELAHLFEPIDPQLMRCRPANPIVNNNRSEGAACLDAPTLSPVSQLDLEL